MTDELLSAAQNVYDKLLSETATVSIIDQERLGDALKTYKPKKSSKAKPVPLAFHYRDHDTLHVRVWMDGWAGDAFEIIDNASWTRFKTMLKRFSIVPIYHELDED